MYERMEIFPAKVKILFKDVSKKHASMNRSYVI